MSGTNAGYGGTRSACPLKSRQRFFSPGIASAKSKPGTLRYLPTRNSGTSYARATPCPVVPKRHVWY
eukprot:521128-Rhodomonas_salina.3